MSSANTRTSVKFDELPKLALGAAIIGGGIYGIVKLMLRKKESDELALKNPVRASIRGEYEQADSIRTIRTLKDRLRDMVKGQPWFRGVGITFKDGHVLRLNVAPDADGIQFPREFEGVPVEIVRMDGYNAVASGKDLKMSKGRGRGHYGK